MRLVGSSRRALCGSRSFRELRIAKTGVLGSQDHLLQSRESPRAWKVVASDAGSVVRRAKQSHRAHEDRIARRSSIVERGGHLARDERRSPFGTRGDATQSTPIAKRPEGMLGHDRPLSPSSWRSRSLERFADPASVAPSSDPRRSWNASIAVHLHGAMRRRARIPAARSDPAISARRGFIPSTASPAVDASVDDADRPGVRKRRPSGRSAARDRHALGAK